MEYIGNGLFRIENIRTGEKRVVKKNELSNYGLSADKGFLGNLISGLTEPITETGRTMVAGAVQAPLYSMAAKAKQAQYGEGTPEFLRPFAGTLSKGYESIGKTLEPIAYTPERYQRVSEKPMEELTGQVGRSLQLGAYGIPVGSTFKGALAGGAGIGGLYSAGRQLGETGQINVGETTKSSLIGAGTGGILNLLGRGVNAVRNLSQPTKRLGESIEQGTRQIKVRPSVTAAGKEENINRTLSKLGFKGSAQQQYENLEPAMQALENKIKQEIARNPQAFAAKSDIITAFRESLKSSIRAGELTEKQAIKEANKYLGDLLKASGGTGKFTNIYLEQLRNLKKLVNEDYSLVQSAYDGGRPLTPRLKVIEAAWRSLDKAVRNSSPEIKRLLSDESNLYKAAKSLSSARFNPPTLRLMGTSLPQFATQKGREISSEGLKRTGNVMSKIPQIPTGKASKLGIISVLAGRGGVVPPEQSGDNIQNADTYGENYRDQEGGQYNAPGDLQHIDTIPQEGNFVQNEDGSWSPRTTAPSEGVGGFPSKEEFRQAMFQAAQSGDPRFGELQSVYKMLYPEEAKTKPLTSVQQTLISNTNSALRALDEVEGILNKDPSMLLKATAPGIIGRLAGASTYNTARKEIADVIGRLRTGAVINEEEMRTYLGKVPELGDRPEDIAYKINEMRTIFGELKKRIEMQSGEQTNLVRDWVNEQMEAGIDLESINQELINQGLDPNEYLQ